MTQASVLKVTANGTTTSPVLRGKWIMERILGFEIPPPPAVARRPDPTSAVPSPSANNSKNTAPTKAAPSATTSSTPPASPSKASMSWAPGAIAIAARRRRKNPRTRHRQKRPRLRLPLRPPRRFRRPTPQRHPLHQHPRLQATPALAGRNRCPQSSPTTNHLCHRCPPPLQRNPRPNLKKP